MEVYQAISLMIMFSMLILALLTYLNKNRPPCDEECGLFLLAAL